MISRTVLVGRWAAIVVGRWAAVVVGRRAVVVVGATLLTAMLGVVGRVRAQDLPTDPSLVTGRLDNGLAYIVKQNANPPGRVSMYMQVSTGSLNETDEQRGLAHYLEHMAFNGSKNFPPGSVVPYFESLGLTFGQHQNAYTSFDHTTFQLDLPDVKPETLGKGMLFFSDIAFRLLLEPKEIDSERQVILEEKRSGLGPQQRIQDYVFSHIAPGSLLGERLPIGVEETINAADQRKFKDYYGKWYVPSNMTVMVVGDLPPEVAVEQIKASFSEGSKVPVPKDQDVGIKPSTGMRAIVASDPELRQAEAGIARISAATPPATTEPLFRAELVEQLGEMIHNRRLQAKVAAGQVRFLRGYAFSTDVFRAARFTQVTASGEPAKWKDMLTDEAAELQRSRLHGFTDRELDDVKKALIASAEQAARTESTRHARAVLGIMDYRLSTGEPLLSSQQQLDLYKKLLPGISVKEVSETFTKLFDPSAVVFVLETPSGGDSPKPPTEDEVVAVGAEALKAAPASESEAQRPTELLSAKPAPGAVAETNVHEASGVTSAWLANGVRFHHRFMDIRKDQVTVTISLAGGPIRETAQTHGLTEAATLAFDRPATGALTSTNIRDLMTDKNVRVGGGAAGDAVQISVSGSPQDLEKGMQLAHLLLTDPVIEKAGFDQWKTEQLQAIEARKLEPSGVLEEAFVGLVFPKEEVRSRPLEAEDINRITLEAAQKWLTELVHTAPIEVSVVGDLSKDAALDLVRAYVGSLPARAKIDHGMFKDLRVIKRPAGPLETRQSVKTMTPQAVVLSGFFGCDHEQVRDAHLLDMAARILSTRMIRDLREKEQLVYGIGVDSQPSTIFPGYGMVVAAAPTDPAKAQTLAKRVAEMFDDFAKSGPSDEEMTVAKTQTANSFAESMVQPGFWIGELSELDYHDIKLDDVLGAPGLCQTFTAAEVREAFAKYRTPERAFLATVVPAAPEAGAAGGK